MELILIVLTVLLIIGALPTFPYSRGWGYAPVSGIITILLIIWLITLIF